MKPTKEQLEYELIIKHFELRDGVLWRKEYVGKNGRVYPARPAKGKIENNGYIRISVIGKYLLEHRIIFILNYNRPIKEGYQIHHTYNNKTDNRIEHLEEVTNQVNCQNKQIHLDGRFVGFTVDNRDGILGDVYISQIAVNGKHQNLGRFNTPEEAHRVYLLAVEEVETYGHLVRSRAERAAAAGAVLRTRGSRLRNTEQRGECEALEYYQLRTNSK